MPSICFITHSAGSFGPLRVKHSSSSDDSDAGASVSEVWNLECARLVSCLGGFQGEDGEEERSFTFPLTLILVSDEDRG